MDWGRLRIFHAFCETEHMTRAGEEVGISQSAVSRQLVLLEQELGMKLINRNPRGMTLTEEGEILYKATSSVFAQLVSATSQLIETKGGLSGPFKIATTIAFGSEWLAPRLPRLYESCPELNLRFILTDETVSFTSREADVAVRFSKDDSEVNVIFDPIGDFQLKVYGSESYFKYRGKPQKPEDLDDHRLIVFGEKIAAPVDQVNWLLHIGTKPGFPRSPLLTINNASGILECVKNGLGVATLADFIARDHPELVNVLPTVKCPSGTLYLSYPKTLAGSKRISVIREFFRQELAAKKSA